MSGNHFDLSSPSNNQDRHLEDVEEDDDVDYDALNNETFGEDVPSSDWDLEAHERFSSFLKEDPDSQDYEGDIENLSERVASFILDDEAEEIFNERKQESKKDPVWHSQLKPANLKINAEKNRSETGFPWNLRSDNHSSDGIPPPVNAPLKPSEIPTVEEIEQRMRSEAIKPQSTPQVTGSSHQDNLVKSAKKYDQQRNVIRHQITHQNGQIRRPPPVIIGGRVPPFDAHQPYPQFTGDQRHIRPQFMRPFPVQQNFKGSGPHQIRIPLDPRRFPTPGILVLPPPPPPQQREFPHHQPRYCEGSVPGGMVSMPYPNHMQQGFNRRPAVPYDEYAGLMSPQEKHWLCSIQMLQLNSQNPIQDDFYFTMYQQRQQGASGRKIGGQCMKNNRETTTKPAYTPLQFENSLGKLQIGSVTAPRKIIDMDIVENVESNPKQNYRQAKQHLMEIEEMYSSLLKFEDQSMNNPAQQSDYIIEVKEKILQSLLVEGKLVAIMAIRKGRRLVLRMISHLNKAEPLIKRLLEDLIPITKRDSEQLLLSFLPSIRTYLSSVPLKTLVTVISSFDSAFLFYNKFTVSVTADLVKCAAQLTASGNVDSGDLERWTEELARVAAAVAVHSAEQPEPEWPVVAVERSLLARHLALLPPLPDGHVQALTRVLAQRFN